MLMYSASILPATGPRPATEARLLSLNWTQSTVVTVLLTGHNTLSRHLNVMGLENNPTL
jgi:hypothetical protein